MNERVNELNKLSREELETMARSMNISTKGSKIGIARRIDQREFADMRTKQKLPMIREIF